MAHGSSGRITEYDIKLIEMQTQIEQIKPSIEPYTREELHSHMLLVCEQTKVAEHCEPEMFYGRKQELNSAAWTIENICMSGDKDLIISNLTRAINIANVYSCLTRGLVEAAYSVRAKNAMVRIRNRLNFSGIKE